MRNSPLSQVNTVKGRKRKLEEKPEETPVSESSDEDMSDSEPEPEQEKAIETEETPDEKQEIPDDRENEDVESKRRKVESSDEEMELPNYQNLSGPKLNFVAVSRSGKGQNNE